MDKWTGWSEPNTPLGRTGGMLPVYCQVFKDHVLTSLKKGKNKIRMEIGYKIVVNNGVRKNKKPLTAGRFTIVYAENREKIIKGDVQSK